MLRDFSECSGEMGTFSNGSIAVAVKRVASFGSLKWKGPSMGNASFLVEFL
jgi:hypothetical protein